MNQDFLKAFAIIIMCAVMTIILKNASSPIAPLLAIFACVSTAAFCIAKLFPFLSFISDLTADTPFGFYSGVLLRVCGIGIITRIACSICRDSGENAYALKAEIIGNTAVLVCALPVIKNIFEQIKDFLN